MDEIEAIKIVRETLDDLEKPERERVITWLISRYEYAGVGNVPKQKDVRPRRGASVSSKSGPKKHKQTLSLMKDINFRPDDEQAFSDFVDEKSPTNNKERCLVAAYYMKVVLGIESVSVNHVFSAYRDRGWKVPADLPNSLQQAGTQGWLDTASGDDIKITTSGENTILHDLPKKSS